MQLHVNDVSDFLFNFVGAIYESPAGRSVLTVRNSAGNTVLNINEGYTIK